MPIESQETFRKSYHMLKHPNQEDICACFRFHLKEWIHDIERLSSTSLTPTHPEKESHRRSSYRKLLRWLQGMPILKKPIPTSCERDPLLFTLIRSTEDLFQKRQPEAIYDGLQYVRRLVLEHYNKFSGNTK